MSSSIYLAWNISSNLSFQLLVTLTDKKYSSFQRQVRISTNSLLVKDYPYISLDLTCHCHHLLTFYSSVEYIRLEQDSWREVCRFIKSDILAQSPIYWRIVQSPTHTDTIILIDSMAPFTTVTFTGIEVLNKIWPNSREVPRSRRLRPSANVVGPLRPRQRAW
jgi:hypothetical protein